MEEQSTSSIISNNNNNSTNDTTNTSPSQASETAETRKEPHRRKLLGKVVSVKTAKTAIVLVERSTFHKRYKKKLKRSKRYMAHDQENEMQLGDKVEIVETRPMSARKRFALSRIIEKNKLSEAADSDTPGRP